MESVCVTGLGIISAIGVGIDESLHSLRNGHTGIDSLRDLDSIHRDSVPSFEVKYTTDRLADMSGLSSSAGMTRTALLAMIAAQEAVRDLSPADSSVRTGFISATTCGGMREFEEHYYDLHDLSRDGDFAAYADTLDSADHTEKVAARLGIRDFVSTVSTACSSSANAIILGAQLIRHGHLDRVVCGGADALCRFTINGFKILMILDDKHCRPFDRSRAGLNLGEGAAYVVLERRSLVRDGRKIWGALTGYSNMNDAFHQTASSPDGNGAMLSMQRAIEMAGLMPADISYINAHGTATENNDLAEGMAIQRLFGDSPPLFSSTKPYTGHTLAAAGSIEAVFSLLAMDSNTIWPSLNYREGMDELRISPVTEIKTNIAVDHAVSNSFGFGGSNTSLLFSKVKHR